MPVSSTVSVPFGRVFTGDNPGGRWSGPVAIDSEFAASGSITLSATVVRTSTWWIQFTGDLELLPNTLGARNDLVVTLTHPSAGSITGDITGYQTAASRDGSTSQANFTPRDSAARTTWCTAVSDDSDALSITLSSASSGPVAPPPDPEPSVELGIALGSRQISKVYIGETEIERAYLGSRLVFGSEPIPVEPVAKITLHTDNSGPRGIWSDGTTMWVSDRGKKKLFAYNLGTGSRDTSKEFNFVSANTSPSGIWSDGTTIWVADVTGDKLYAYVISTGSRDIDKEFDLDENTNTTDIWSNGTIMWVLNNTSSGDKLEGYNLATGSRSSLHDISMLSPNLNSTGVWLDGTTVWVADVVDDKIYAYSRSNGSRDTDKDFNLASGNIGPRGLWSDGTILWVSDGSVFEIYSYVLATGTLRT